MCDEFAEENIPDIEEIFTSKFENFPDDIVNTEHDDQPLLKPGTSQFEPTMQSLSRSNVEAIEIIPEREEIPVIKLENNPDIIDLVSDDETNTNEDDQLSGHDTLEFRGFPIDNNNSGNIVRSKKRPLEDRNSIRPHNKKHKGFIRKTKHQLDCEICYERAKNQNDSIFHRKKHLNEYPIHSRICFRFFSSNRNRIAHQKKCNSLRYECYACGLIPRDLSKLKTHFRIHTGQSFKCKWCTMRFTFKCNMIFHQRKTHG